MLALDSSGSIQHGLNSTHTEVVVILLGELFKHELVDGDDLLGKRLVFLETFRHKRDFANGVEVWGHHSDWSEQIGEIVGKFRSACVARVHGDEEAGVFADCECSVVDAALLALAFFKAV